ncbi:hypothetical protein QQS21_008458 [Conoideocrella luteorostrata]|uniref:Uncharacterized protein n=1 Tax=Conoideocrella luteorostrata TaxID=1105319 RepID=A0AAJ0CIT6_9HYPO|nr:hypothetical protein QQS21_008458 [Conoideocrella luteorostrata]
MGGFRLKPAATDEENLVSVLLPGSNTDQCMQLVLNASQFSILLKDGAITELPRLSIADINAKSKSDAFAKLVAFVEILWLVISVVARSVRKYSTSQLEILTLAFAVCSLLSYAFSWHKPQNVGTAFVLDARPGCFSNNTLMERIVQLQGVQEHSFWAAISSPGKRPDLDQLVSRIPNDNVSSLRKDLRLIVVIWSLVTIIFGIIHLIAWNYRYPTVVECWAWRATTLIAVCFPAISLAVTSISAGLALGELHDGRTFASTLFDLCDAVGSLESETNQPFCRIPKPIKDCIICDARAGIIDNWTDLLHRYNVHHDVLLYLLSALENAEHPISAPYPRFTEELRRLHQIMDNKRRPQESRAFNYNDGADKFCVFPKIMNRERSLLDRQLRGCAGLGGLIRRFAGRIGDWLSEHWPRRLFLLTCSTAYCAARLAMIVVAITSLRRMPDDVYNSTWPW